MSIDINWLKNNINNDPIIFDIGVAGLHSEIAEFRNAFPLSKIYAFECNDFWLKENISTSIDYGVNYFHVAMSDTDGIKNFIPSVSENGLVHPYSGSFFKDCLHGSKKVYGEPYEVRTVRLDTFCKKYNITPDFIHIDVEGNEFYVLSAMGEYKPKLIWTELVGFNSYECGVTFDEFNALMDSLGYNFLGRNGADGIYYRKDFPVEQYNF